MSNPLKQLIPSRGVRARYGNVSSRTLRRWIVTSAIPPPDLIIRGRNFWWESTLVAHERRLVAERLAAKKPTAEISSAT